MKYYLIYLMTIFSMIPFAGHTQPASPFQTSLDSIFSAFKNKDYAFLKPLLDDNVKIGDLPKGMNDMVVPQLLAQLPEPKAYNVTGSSNDSGGTIVHTLYTFMDGQTAQRNFLFGANGKISDFDILGDLHARAANITTTLAATPDRFELSFELKEGIIYVKGWLNGREETFILDSGAPLLILNSDNKHVDSVTSTANEVNGVGGKAATGITHIRSFDWNGLQIKDADVMTMSLAHLQRKNTAIAGLIGYSVFKDYQLTFNYAQRKITAVRADLVKNATVSGALPTTVQTELKGHLPVFMASISGKSYRMALDCGAGSNLLYARYMPNLENQVKNITKAKLEGAGSNSIKAKKGKIKETSIGKVVYRDMNFAFDNETLDQLNDGYQLGIDGLLGYDFLKTHVTSVNFSTGEMLIYGK